MALRFFLLVALAGALSSPASAEEGCLSDWGAAGEIVRREGLRTVEQLTLEEPRQLDGQIVKATLCREAKGYVYRLVVRGPGGQMKNVMLNAAGHALGSKSP